MFVLSACTSRHIEVLQEEAYSAAESYVKDDNANVAGPLKIKRLRDEDMAVFSASDREAIAAFIKEGAYAFVVLVPDYSLMIHTSKGTPIEMSKIARIVVVKSGKIAGDFAVMEKPHNR